MGVGRWSSGSTWAAILSRILRTLDRMARVEQLYAELPGRDHGDFGEALGLLEQRHLIRTTFERDSLQLTPEGRAAVDDGCVLELVLGPEYISEHCSPATVHVVVQGTQQREIGGTGFFSADYPGWIVTAAHIIQNRDILRIEDQNFGWISEGPFQVLLGPDRLDLGLISCAVPEGIAPLHIEWVRRQFVRCSLF